MTNIYQEEFFSTQENIAVVNDNTYELNIQPPASILNVFSRLSYKPWYAIAEFVDNSTQSYLTHADVLDSDPVFEKLIVSIRYNSVDNTLMITDNAYGMEIDKFKDAILLDAKNDDQIGRNEFGMGLKTAASWFGNVWTVISTQYGSDNRFSATINIPELKSSGVNSIKIHRSTAPLEEHGTIILIQEVTKKINASRTIGKIRELLSSMYRRDINSKNIEIWFNDEPISFEEYPVLKNFRGKEWKKPLDFMVPFDGREYHVTGFVAIMNPGSFPKAGFALFRQDRVVVGGTDLNYKPSQIFGQAQSQRSLKLFGELNMNDFPVNQAKDGFIWDDGLEDAFIEALRANIQEYIAIADLSKQQREGESQYSETSSNKLQQDISASLQGMVVDPPAIPSSKTTQDNAPVTRAYNEEEAQEYIETVLQVEEDVRTVGTVRQYSIPISPVETILINVQWAIGKQDYWIEYNENSEGGIDVTINIEHPFFMPYSQDENFKKVLEKFVLAFVMAEQQAKITSDKTGYIKASIIKNNMNRYLSKLTEG